MPPAPVVRVFYADTEGNPFLMEELFRHLAEQGKLFDEAGEFRADIKTTDLTVPESLRLVTGRRLARLDPKTLKILDSAAVIGRSFTFQLLASSIQADPDSLLDSLEEAENAGLISSSVQYPDAQFRFSHELIRRSVVDRISIARRQHLHLAIAKAIELTGAGSTEKVGELAYHLVQAGASADGAKTARILALAARQALAQGALTEAEAYFQQAQDVLETTAPGVAHDRQELALQLALGQVFIATRGYVAPETVAAYDRARVLGERLGEPMQVMLALIGQFSGPLLRGEGEGTGALANAIFATAEHIGSSPALTWGNFVQGVVAYHRGDLHDANRYLEAAIESYRSDDYLGNPQDPGTEALEYLALTCWQRGLADTARTRMRQAVALAEKLHKPFALVHIRFYEAYLSALLRDSATTLRQSQPAIDLAQGQSVPLFFDAGRILLGWAMAEQGRFQEGLAMARVGLAGYMAAGNRNSIARFLGLTAEIEGRAESIDRALTTVEEAFASSADELIDRPYLLWLRGKLLYERAGQENCASTTSDLQAAEKNFRDSIALANRMGAQSYALRAATSLAQLLSSSGHRADAQQMLGPSLAQFVEGFDTRDLIEARAVASGVS
jgi:predicted ATPase